MNTGRVDIVSADINIVSARQFLMGTNQYSWSWPAQYPTARHKRIDRCLEVLGILRILGSLMQHIIERSFSINWLNGACIQSP